MRGKVAWAGAYVGGFPDRIRTSVLARDRVCACGGCRSCGGFGCSRASVEVDHRVSVAECKRLGVDPNVAENAQGLCGPCHLVKTQREIAAGRARLIPKRKAVHPSDPLGGVPPPQGDCSTDGITPASAYENAQFDARFTGRTTSKGT